MQSDKADGKKKWTVMVFMGAATIEGEESLLEAAEDDLEEMASVGSGIIQSTDGAEHGQLNIYVQVYTGKQPGSAPGSEPPPPRFGRITEGMFNDAILNPKRQVGDVIRAVGKEMKLQKDGKDIPPIGPEALEKFVENAILDAGHAPGDYSMLVLWGHAYDFAINRAEKVDGTIDALDFAELSTVLRRLQQRLGYAAKLDILGFDACGLATVEMACQLEPFATYLLASEIGIPIPGWPYHRIFDRLRNPYGRLMNSLEFGSYAVRRFCESHAAETLTVSLTLLNLERVTDLRAHTECLALTLTNAIVDPGERDRFAALISQSQTEAGKPFVDLGDVCLNLLRWGGDARVIEAARALGDLLISPPPSPMIGKRSGDKDMQKDLPLLVEHGRNSAATARLNGISFYAPHVAPRPDFNTLEKLYLNFEFATTQWSGLMHAFARLS